MRLLFVAGRAWPAVGGVESLVRHVAAALAEEHEVTVLALRNDNGPSTRLTDNLKLPPPFQPYRDGGVAYEPLELSRSQRAALAPQALQVVPGVRRYAYTRVRSAFASNYAAVAGKVIASRSPKPDLIHTWTTDLLAAAGVRAARSLAVPALVTPFLHVGQWGADRTSVRTYRKADRVVGLLETEKRQLVELGVPEAKVAVCGACTPPLVDEGLRVRDQHRIDGPLILFVGARRSYKGVDRLLAAAPSVAARVPGATFAFVGPGAPIEAPAGVRTIDAGKVEPAELTSWLSEADLLCLPSQHEIFPTSILEAWSRETPVLTSDIPTLRELIARSDGGRTASREPAAIADAIVGLLRDPAALREHARNGKAFWQANGTPRAVADCYLRQYRQLTGMAPLRADSPAQ